MKKDVDVADQPVARDFVVDSDVAAETQRVSGKTTDTGTLIRCVPL